MTNGELIERLQAFPANFPIVVEVQDEHGTTWPNLVDVEQYNFRFEGNVINLVPQVKA